MRCHACEIGDTGCGGIVTNASGVFKGDVSVMPIRFCPRCGRNLCETRMEMAR